MVMKTKKDMSTTTQLEFNRDNYNYFDSLPLIGQLWDFIRRNEKNRAYYQKSMRAQTMSDMDAHMALLGESEFVHLRDLGFRDPDKTWGESEDIFFPKPSIFHPVETYSLGKYERNILGAGKIDNKLMAFFEYNENSLPLQKAAAQMGNKNIIMALIDISAPGKAKDLAAKIEKEISAWKNKLKVKSLKKPRAIPPKHSPSAAAKLKNKPRKNNLIGNATIWKSYIIIYDLITGYPHVLPKPRTLEEVSGILSKIDDFYSSLENIRNHYDEAKYLVNDGYRQYLDSFL